MSQIHKVIILNQPIKIYGFAIWQWCLLTVALGLAFLLFSKIPGNWKVGNLPLGFLLGLGIFCIALVFVHASEMKPMIWWRNLIFFKLLKVDQKDYHSQVEEITDIYPDPNIIDIPKRKNDIYIDLGS